MAPAASTIGGKGLTKFLEFGLNGKVALVTGAGRGLGRSIALALAHAGADIAVNGSNAAGLASVAAEIKAMGRRVVEVPADLSDVALIGAMVKKAESALGPIDILVNNAGINQVEPSLDVEPETWDRLMDVNLRAPFFCAQAVAGGMIERRRGKIINIASDAGIVGYAGHAAYGTTKGGLIQLTRILAVEWGPHNVQVNAICPGADMVGHDDAGHAEAGDRQGVAGARCRRPHHRPGRDRRRRGVPGVRSVQHDHRTGAGCRRRLDREMTGGNRMNRLKDQVAIVTGASKGIGRASALGLAREGAAVVAVARSADKLESLKAEIEQQGGRCLVVAGDVAQEATARQAVEGAVDTFGRMDVLLNNAGIGSYADFLDYDVEAYDEIMNTNMRSTFLFTRHAVPVMKSQKKGLILQVSSQAGIRGFTREAVYCATKHAQVGFTNALRIELQPFGIKVAVICPAGVKTEFALGKGRTQDFVDQSGFLEAEDVADAVVFAATQRPNARMTQINLIALHEGL